MIPFLAPIRISRVDVECVDESKADLFQATLSITILNPLSCLGFFQDRYKYQFSPCVDVMIIWRPEGSIKSLCIDISVGFLGIWTLISCSACDSSIRTITLDARPIASMSELTTKDMSGAGNAY